MSFLLSAVVRVHLFLHEKRAQDLIEYALLVALLSLTAAAILPDVGYRVWFVLRQIRRVMRCTARMASTCNIPEFDEN